MERRASALPEVNDVIRQRAVPAVFIVDASLRVLYFCEDPRERRNDCVYEPGSHRLPPLIERAVRTLLDESGDASQVRSLVPNASIVVRLVPLKGDAQAHYGVFVERLKMRASLKAVGQRYALSSREQEALALVLKGAKNTEIATHLQIAPSTAVFHVKRLMQKTGARNRTELVAKVVG